jgi:hypothetical protein
MRKTVFGQMEAGWGPAGSALRDELEPAIKEQITSMVNASAVENGLPFEQQQGLETMGELTFAVGAALVPGPVGKRRAAGSLDDAVGVFAPRRASRRGSVSVPGGASGGASKGALQVERGRLVDVLRARLRQQGGFADEGVPIILDENLQAGAAHVLRERGFNVRTVEEVFGRFGVKDPEIIGYAEQVGARVLTKNVSDFPPSIRVGVPKRGGETNVDLFEQLLEHEGLRSQRP